MPSIIIRDKQTGQEFEGPTGTAFDQTKYELVGSKGYEPTPEKPSFLKTLGNVAGRAAVTTAREFPSDLMGSLKNIGRTLGDKNLPVRLAPMTVPGAGPLLASAMNIGSEAIAQADEGEWNKRGLALGALPAILAGGGRAVRAADRMATRLSQPRFQAAQRGAMDSADDLVKGLTPDTRALYQQAQQARAGAPPVDLPETTQTLSGLTAQHGLAPAMSPASQGGRDIVQQAAPLGAGQPLSLDALDAFMQELNLAIRSRAPGADKAKLLSGAVVKDMDAAAGSGNAGAAAARQAATGYKQQLGATRVGEHVTKAAPSLTGVGPSLNVANLEKLIRGDKELPRLLGPSGMGQVEQFVDRFRGLPPDHAAQFYPMLLATLGAGGGVGALATGQNPATAAAALASPFVAEYLRNLFYVGANPKSLNHALTAAGQAGRIGLQE